MLTFPIMMILFVLADSIVFVVLNAKWMPIIIPLRILSLVGMIKSIDVIIPQMLLARGRANAMLKYSTAVVFTLPLAFFIGTFNGINGVAFAWMFTYPILFFILLFFSLKEIDLSLKAYFDNVFPQFVGSCIMGCIMWILQRLGRHYMNGESVGGLLFSIAGGLIVYSLCMYWQQPAEMQEIKTIFNLYFKKIMKFELPG